MTTQQSNTKLTMPIKDTIILDNKKCNAELLTIHPDGRITVAEHLKPTETATELLKIMREQWMADAQSKKIREQEDRIKRLEEAFTELEQCNLTDENCANMDVATRRIRNFARRAKEAKP